MNTKLVRVLPAAAVLAAVVAVSASTGAVAGALITGADIKNGSVASADIKNKSITGKDVKDGALGKADLSAATVAELMNGKVGLVGPIGLTGQAGPKGDKGSPGIAGLRYEENSKDISAGTGGALLVDCSAGEKILGIAADWTASVNPTATSINPNLSGGAAYGFNDTGAAKTLRVTATCAAIG